MEPLGGGPNGEVYRAKVVGVAGMERQLAVKRFHAQVTTAAGVSAKLSQASRTYGSLDHPRIARLAELGVAGGETFTATELVVGLDLSRLITMAHETGQPLPAGASLGVVSAAARAIGYAHGRGVSHLGLSPTNVIATPDGDAKVTDVGILSCRLPPRPATDPSLLLRLPYLAPEQLVGDPVSAATDVFALGVIAYEMITGVKPFAGGTAFEIEQAILSARPAPLELPRPVSRVLDRCMARSPFERFPDARALADALDAALRLSPLAGGKRDVGDRVTSALEHIARINEQQLSGALSFAVPTPPGRGGSAVLPLQPPATARAVPAAARPAATASVSPPAPPQRATLRSHAPPLPRAATDTTGEPTIARDPAAGGGAAAAEIDESNLSIGDKTEPRARIEPLWPPTEPVQTLKGIVPPPLSSSASAAGSPPPQPPPQPPPVRAGGSQPPPLAAPAPPAPPFTPAAGPGPHPVSYGGGGYGTTPDSDGLRLRRSRVSLFAVLGAAAAIAAVGGFFLHRHLTRTDASAVAAGPPPAEDAGAAATTAADAATKIVVGGSDAGETVATAPIDAGAPPADAAAAGAVTDAAPRDRPPVAPGDKLVIRSTPPGARVFLDGTDQGKTPATIAGSADRLSLAVVLPGHALYLSEVAGAGEHSATLVPVKEWVGAGGIKVRCKTGGRYYVFIDGQPTGELCPTERIPVDKGEHQVEIYDLVTEGRKQFKVVVKQVSRSTRVRVD
ncbi:MAG TPA: serine/threonine-protein kinase [Kofleriaceae bacterium]|nr:serine/threonine-protein kinase [Kofleriaceae bacterium]